MAVLQPWYQLYDAMPKAFQGVVPAIPHKCHSHPNTNGKGGVYSAARFGDLDGDGCVQDVQDEVHQAMPVGVGGVVAMRSRVVYILSQQDEVHQACEAECPFLHARRPSSAVLVNQLQLPNPSPNRADPGPSRLVAKP